MKTKWLLFSCSLFIGSLCVSCSQYHSSGKSSLTVSESETEYRIIADYPENNTRKVERFMNEKIGNRNDISFVNATIDAQLTLDDGTKIYVVNKPGTLKITLDKNENSEASYGEIKALGEGLKPFLNEDVER